MLHSLFITLRLVLYLHRFGEPVQVLLTVLEHLPQSFVVRGVAPSFLALHHRSRAPGAQHAQAAARLFPAPNSPGRCCHHAPCHKSTMGAPRA